MWSKLEETIQEFQNCFPNEANNINEFFYYLYNLEGIAFSPLRSITFQELLERYFKDNRLKAILSLPLLGNAGLPSNLISAVTGVLVYKEFMHILSKLDSWN